MALIIEKVMADIINERLPFALKLGQYCTNYTNMIPAISEKGGEVIFPKFLRNCDTTDMSKTGTELTPAEIDMASASAPIRVTGSSYRIYDKDQAQISTDVISKMSEQLISVMAIDVDESLSKSILSEVKKVFPCEFADAITDEELLLAYSLFGDSINASDFSCLAINSRLIPSFLRSEMFVSKSKTFTQDGSGIAEDNILGYWLNIPVVVTNNSLTYDSEKKEVVSAFIKKGSVGFVLQKNVTLEQERMAKLLATDLVVSDMYSTLCLEPDDIVLIRKTVA